jgi:hypothetical protein
MFLHNLLNVLVQIANKMGFKKIVMLIGRRGGVVGDSVSYVEVPGFSRVSRSLMENAGRVLKLSHDLFLPHPFQFTFDPFMRL